MNTLKTWNPYIKTEKMSRVTPNDIKDLYVGMSLYYINMNDFIIGAVYDAKIIQKNQRMMLIECTPVVEVLPCDTVIQSNIKPHTESIAFIDLYGKDTLQYLFHNLVC